MFIHLLDFLVTQYELFMRIFDLHFQSLVLKIEHSLI